jgi:hypothetical protein
MSLTAIEEEIPGVKGRGRKYDVVRDNGGQSAGSLRSLL